MQEKTPTNHTKSIAMYRHETIMPSMPWRFYRYMLVDVLRQFTITAVILVVVIAFGAAIKPLSGDRLLTGWDTLKYLALAIVPMMQFALPFAAAFAATLGLHRLAQDNEIIAMAVSGHSYMKLLAPMAFFGAVLTIVIAILTQAVIPTFVGQMAEAMTADLPRLLTNSIKQHTPFVQGDLVIWAEDIFLDTSNDDERMALDKVAVAKMDNTGRVVMVLTAAAAVVDVQRTGNQTSLHVATRDAAQWTRELDGSGVLRGAKEGRLTHAIDLPTLSRQSPASLTIGELHHLRDHPNEYPPVDQAMFHLRTNLIQNAYFIALEEQFSRDHVIECTTATGGRRFIIESNGMNGNEFIPPITVKTIRTTGEINMLEPNHAKLLLDQSATGEIDSVTLQMTDVIVGAGQVGENQRGELVVPNLQIENFEPEEQVASSISELLAIADAMGSRNITQAAEDLRFSLDNMENQIVGRIGQRWAVSFLPFIIVILGSLLAIRFSDRVPLAVYAKVFVPAVFTLLLIFAGGQMLRDGKEFIGFFVMWIGNCALTCLVLFHWLRLRLV